MPNHFHLLLQQVKDDGISQFLQRFGTSYTQFINKGEDRSGSLFESVFKARQIDSYAYLLHITRYIHRNSTDYFSHKRLDLFRQPSSYPNYLGELKQDWVKPEFILQNFDKAGFNSYQAFVESEDNDLEQKAVILLHNLELD